MNLLPILAQDATFWLPKAASNLAVDVDWAWNIILWVTGLFFCIVVGAMTLFVFKYRRRTPNDATSEITHNTPLEIAWTFIPLIIVIMFFWVGFKGFLNYDNPASNCVIVDVQAQKWKFTFTYPNGAISDDLYVLKDQPVRLNLHSIDVLHALYLPTFRTQRNLIPYRQTTIWFVPTAFSPAATKDDPGGYPIFCTQFCGDGHSRMFAHAYVLAKEEFDLKMTELANPFKMKKDKRNFWVPYKDIGKTLYSQMGCSSCHTLDGTLSTGPTWKGLWKRDHQFAYSNVPGYALSASDPDSKWEDYLNESVIHPEVKLVQYLGKNYPNAMPQFGDRLDGSEANVEKRRAIIEFIKFLGDPEHYKPAADPTKDADLFDADKHPDHHPESEAAIKARTTTQPAQ